ncbi:MAG: BLUF domain-containing protein [Myxococcota bacterium]
MSFTQLSYVSRPVAGTTIEDVRDIFEVSMIRNRQAQITGFLVHRHDRFVQIIEGPPGGVVRLFETIRADPRHEEVVLIGCRRIPERRFSEWSMGYLAVQGTLANILLRRTGEASFTPEALPHEALVALVAELSGRTAMLPELEL